MTEAEPLQQIGRTHVKWRGRKLSYYGGCDYFRLSSHPKVIQAVHDGLRKYGLSVSASRRTTGNHVLYQKLERELARFFGAEAALLIGGGYSADQVATQALAGDFTHALIDEYSHLALRDAAQMLQCPVSKFRHQDADDLARQIKKCGGKARVIVMTDGMFSNNGTVPPLARYLKVLPGNGLLLVDDAHAAGTLGETGKGSIEVEGISRKRVLQSVALSKAVGVYGGALLCSRAMREKITSASHVFAGSTPLPLPLAYAACESLRLLNTDPRLRARLNGNAAWIKDTLRKAGFELPNAPGPIVPIIPENRREASRLRRELLEADILPPYLQYPSGPMKGYFRFVISSEHSPGQLKRLAQVLARALPITLAPPPRFG